MYSLTNPIPHSAAFYLKLAFNHPTKDRKYIKILEYIKSHPGCTNIDIANGLGIELRNYPGGAKMVGWQIVTALACEGYIKISKGEKNKNHYSITEFGKSLLKKV